MERKIIVGCPAVKEDIESFKEMMFSLVTTTYVIDKIIIVTPHVDELQKIVDENSGYFNLANVVKNPGNTPLDAYNELFRITKEEQADLFLTQTDILFPKLYKRDWLRIMKEISKNPSVGCVTSINYGGISGPDYVNGLPWVGGWCTYIPYETIEKIGGYDDNFPNGYGVDIDWSYRLHQAGLRIIQANYWVDHHMMNERAHDRDPKTEQMKQESSKYFKQKWKLTN